MKPNTLSRLSSALRRLPPQQADAARFVMGRRFDAAATPMRSLARDAGLAPVTFTRLAQSLGMTGWDELRALLLEEARNDLKAANKRPFSARPLPAGGNERLGRSMIEADTYAIGSIDLEQLSAAAAILEKAPRVFVAGFRSCFAPAFLFHYLYCLFRSDVDLIGSNGSMLDIELGSIRRNDAVLLFGFDPYSRDGLLCAQAAEEAQARVIAVVDQPTASIAEGAAAVLTFDNASPGFFPSLAACTSLVQALAALLYSRSGKSGKAQLRRSEARIAAHAPYLSSPSRSLSNSIPKRKQSRK